MLCKKIAQLKGKDKDDYKRLITFVKDRSGHDRRYTVNCDKIKQKRGWVKKFSFEEGLDKTIKWYMNNQDWVDRLNSEEYRQRHQGQ